MIVDRGLIAAALPDYEFGEPIGSGPHGVVLAARHRKSGVVCAVKVLTAPESGAFLAAPDHPHVVRVVASAARDGLGLVVSEFVSGGSLTDRGNSAPETVCAWGLAAASALEAAHRVGVVHGGIKPTNLLLDAERALKVGDFGFAVLDAGAHGSPVAPVAHEPTARYVAPERVLGAAPDAPGDIYSLAVVLHDLLPADAQPMPHVAALLLRMLDDDPLERPSAGECVAELAAAAARDLGPDWPWRSAVPLRVAAATGAEAARAQPRLPGFGWLGVPARSGGSAAPPAVATSAGPHAAGAAGKPAAAGAAGKLAAAGAAGLPAAAGAAGSGGVAVMAGPSGAVVVSGPARGAVGARRAWVAVAAVVALGLGAVGTGVVVLGAPSQAPAPAVALAMPEEAGALAVHHGAPGTPTRLAYAPSTDRVAFVDATGSLYVWTPNQVWAPGKADAVGPIRAPGTFGDVRFDDTDGSVVTTGTDGTVRVWSADTGKQVGAALPGLGPNPTALAETGQGGYLAVADATGIRISRNGTFVAMAPGVQVTARGLAFSPDGKLLASAGPGGVQLWDVETGALRTRLTGATGNSPVAFSVDGTHLAAASGKNTVRAWDVGTGHPVGPDLSVGILSSNSAIAFNDRGDQLVTAVGTTITRWEPTTGATVGEPLILGNGATSATLNSDATRVAVAFDDGTIRVHAMF
ncbi:protein kinase family protein [Cryptosporangium sp. NPDC048952]|uniref:protein kinase family protein n=1 Tax=Cryptosporangium sp. NPDC048952 TaxID=3363961 RepID=UPI003713E663